MNENQENINQENTNNLRESLDYSRQLIDNAKILYNVNKENTSELYKGFRDSAKILAKSLNDMSKSFGDQKNISNSIKNLEQQRLNLAIERESLEKKALKEKLDNLERIELSKDKAELKMKNSRKASQTAYLASKKIFELKKSNVNL